MLPSLFVEPVLPDALSSDIVPRLPLLVPVPVELFMLPLDIELLPVPVPLL
jgi:hypothetical protein